MPYSLKNRNVLVTGGSRGLGALICDKFAAEGSNVMINYNASPDRAKEVAATVGKHGVKAAVVQGDMCLAADCKKVVDETAKVFGSVDIVIHNAGWTKMTEFGDLHAKTEEEWDKCWAINSKAILHLAQAAMPYFKENEEGGSIIVTSSIAGTGPVGSSMAYSTTKAAGLHMVQCLAQTQGPALRINAVCPGLLLTEWGLGFSPEKIQGAKNNATLKKETDLDDCANIFVSIAKNSSMTGEKIRVDSGLFIRR